MFTKLPIICIVSIFLYIETCDSKLNIFNDSESSFESNEIDQQYNSIIDFKPISSANYVLSTEMLAQRNTVRGILNYSLGQRLSGNFFNQKLS